MFGGASDESKLMVEIALFDFGSDMEAFRNSALMQGEVFGPLAPMVTYSDIRPVLRSIEKLDGKPLSFYCYTRE